MAAGFAFVASAAPFVFRSAGMRQHGFGEHFVVPVDRDDVVLHHQCQQVVLILGVEFAGILAEQRRHVEGRDDRYRADLSRLTRPRVLAVASTFGGQIDDHGTRLHAGDLRLADEFWRWPAGNGGCRDDQVGRLNMLRQHRGNLGLFVCGQFAGVTAFTAGIDAGLDKSRAQRQRLFLGFRANIVAFGDGTQTMCGRERLQSGDAKAHDQHFGGTDRAGRCRDLRQDATEMGRAKLHGVVARQRGLTGQRIHRLRPRDARHISMAKQVIFFSSRRFTSAGCWSRK